MKKRNIIPVIIYFSASAVRPIYGAQNCTPYYRALAAVRRELFIDYKKYRDRPGPETWGSDGTKTLDFGKYFESLLPNGGFPELFRTRKAAGQTNHILDLFGSALFADPDTADSATAVRIKPLSAERAPDLSHWPEGRRKEIYGNVFSLSTILELRKRLADLRITGFDVIVARPIGGYAVGLGGLSRDDRDRALLVELREQVRRYYALLSPSGEMYLQFVGSTNTPEFKAWKDDLKRQGVECKIGKFGIRLRKVPGASPTLQFPLEPGDMPTRASPPWWFQRLRDYLLGQRRS